MSNELMPEFRTHDPEEREFQRSVHRFIKSITPVLDLHPEYRHSKILERIIEPERAIEFRVPWMDDDNVIQINRGFRVEFSSVLGPYTGGLRFHSSMNLDSVKSAGFSQMIKNALTTLPLGGGSGAADFDPKEKSDNESMRFCQRFMSELFRYLGENVDILTRGVGVGGREIALLSGQYKMLSNKFGAVFAGKGIDIGGTRLQNEAKGYGCVYYIQEMLKTKGDSLNNKEIIVSGSDSTAIHIMEKALNLGAKCIACNDSDGALHDPQGLDLNLLRKIKIFQRGRLDEYLQEHPSATFSSNRGDLWTIKCDIVFLCSPVIKLNSEMAQHLVNNGCTAVCETCTMSSDEEAVQFLAENEVLFGPADATTVGYIIMESFEISQNKMGLCWTVEEIDKKLQNVMSNVYKLVTMASQHYCTRENLYDSTNIAAFIRLAQAISAQGLI